MANRNLIAGAATAYAPTFVDAGESLGLTSAGRSGGINPSALNRLANMRSVDSQVKAYIDSLNTEMDLVGLSEMEDLSIRAYLGNKKQEYLEAATLLSQTDPTSSEYVNLKAKMDGIKTGFTNLKGQIDKFKERKVQYLDDFENGRISKGNKEDDYYNAGKAYGGGALYIDQNGGLNMYVDGGTRKIDYSAMKDPFLKDFKTADEILQQNNKLYTAGVKLDTTKEALLRNQLKNQLSRDGALESIVEDGLINNERLNVDIAAYATREDAINDVAEMLLQGYRDSAAAGANEKMIKQQKNNPGGTGGGAASAQPEGTYLGYGRNTDADKKNFKAQYDAVQKRAALEDPKGLTLLDKDGNVLVEGDRSEERSVKWYSSADSEKYQGRVPRGGVSEWLIRPYKYKKDDGKIYYGVQWRDRDGNWQILQPGDFEKELSGTAGVTPQDASKFNKNQSN